jgi:hypothetical protein
VRYVGYAAAAAATVRIGAAMAADGDHVHIRGDATKGMLERNTLNIATAEKIAQACVAKATKEDVKVSIAIATNSSSTATQGPCADHARALFLRHIR